MRKNVASHHIFSAQSHQTEPYLYIGKVAEITGASCKAIRHYESIGLIPVPRRRGKYRIYSEQDVFLIHMVRHAQLVGFSLKEIKVLVAEKIKGAKFPLQLANDLFERKRAVLRDEVKALQELDRRLEALKEDMNRIFGDQAMPT
jgi:DNA-binding transcriptional MerR regulator